MEHPYRILYVALSKCPLFPCTVALYFCWLWNAWNAHFCYAIYTCISPTTYFVVVMIVYHHMQEGDQIEHSCSNVPGMQACTILCLYWSGELTHVLHIRFDNGEPPHSCYCLHHHLSDGKCQDHSIQFHTTWSGGFPRGQGCF